MIKTSLQYVEAVTLQTQRGHWPTSPTCPCGVWESQEVRGFNATWFEDDAFFVCFSAVRKFLSWDECGWCMAIAMIHIDSPWSTMLQAVQSSSKDTSASHSRLMHEQQRSSRKLHFFESFLLKTRLFRLHSQVCLRNKGWNEWNLPSTVYLVWWPEVRYSTVNQTLTLFSSYEPCFWLQFSGDFCDFSHLELLWAMFWICFETSWGLYVEYYAGRGPGF